MTNFEKISRQIRRSWLFKYILHFLSEKEITRLQILDKFFYEVQIPRLLPLCSIKLEKTRLHFLN